MKRLVPISVLVLTALLLTVAPPAANAQAGNYSIYVVRPGDTLSSIASRYCMSWQELYNLNSSVVSNPNQLYPGMQLRVVNRCGGGSSGGYSGCYQNCAGAGGVYDRGPQSHARGYVYGNTYVVALGDTSFSIGQRFGMSVTALCQANGINPWHIWAGQKLIIPGLGTAPCQPVCPPIYPPVYPTPYPCPTWPCPVPTVLPIPITPVPSVTPVPTAPTPIVPRIQITAPAPNATLPPTFTVTGSGQGLFEGSLVVRAVNNVGTILAELPTTLQGANVGAGGPGTFSVNLTVNVPAATPGFIVAFAPQTPTAPAVSVPVTFSASGGGGTIIYKDYQGTQCRVAVLVGQPFFAQIGAAPLGTFANPGTFVASRAAKEPNNQLWFFIGPVPATPSSVWVPLTSVGSLTPACWW
jgi:LysM repeat protein